MVTFLASSGVRSKDMRKLKLQDFVDATQEYHNKKKDVIPELEDQEVIPCWIFNSEKTDTETITFNTPECTNFIITYLKQRTFLSNDQYLFSSNKNGYYSPLSGRGLNNYFEAINDKLGFPKLANGFRFFRPHRLRTFFGTTLTNNEVPYNLYKKMMGQTFTQVDSAYVRPNWKACKRAYKRCIKDLSTQKVEIRKVTSDEIKKIVHENQGLKTDVEGLKKEMNDYKEFLPVIRAFAKDPGKLEEIIEKLGQK